MGANNQGIMHLAGNNKPGSLPACRNRNAHMSTSLEEFEQWPRQCVKCQKHAAAWKRMRARRAECGTPAANQPCA